MSKDQSVAVGVVFIAVSLLLMTRPNCPRGCRTLAEHLLQHGLADLLFGL